MREEGETIKMTVHLLNSAMMPAANGIYQSKALTREEFAERALESYNKGVLISYVGYKQTAEILSDLCGFEVRENRKETLIEDGDMLLIARIKYRLANHLGRDAKPSIDDLEFRVVYYSADNNGD